MKRQARDSQYAAAQPAVQDAVRLSAPGAAKVLGDLEARVMHAVWELGGTRSAREIHTAVVPTHEVAFVTVVTVLNKLVEKRWLTRAKRGDLLHYTASVTEDEFTTRTSRRMVEGVLSFGADMAAASFVDVLAERDPAQLAELARLVRERLSQSKP